MEQALNQIDAWQDRFPELVSFIAQVGVSFASALAILIAGLIIGRVLSGRLRRSKIGGAHLDATLRPVLASLTFYIILAMTLYAVLVKIGVPPTSLLAAFGGMALAIGLALRDTLANIAAGVMLLVLRPLKVGDFVDMPIALGTIEEIGLFSTTVRNMEGVAVYIPNSQIWGNRIQNFGRHTHRKAIVEIGVGYGSNLRETQAVLMKILSTHPDMLDTPTPPEVYVMSFADSAINFSCRVWLPGDEWLRRMTDLRIAIKDGLNDAGIEIPFPQRVIHMAKSDD